VNFEKNPCGRRSSCNSGLGPRVSGRPDLSFRSMARDQHPFVFTRGQPRRCSWMLCTMNRNRSAEPVSHSPKKGEITGQSERHVGMHRTQANGIFAASSWPAGASDRSAAARAWAGRAAHARNAGVRERRPRWMRFQWSRRTLLVRAVAHALRRTATRCPALLSDAPTGRNWRNTHAVLQFFFR
jgi:hypothetical protein